MKCSHFERGKVCRRNSSTFTLLTETCYGEPTRNGDDSGDIAVTRRRLLTAGACDEEHGERRGQASGLPGKGRGAGPPQADYSLHETGSSATTFNQAGNTVTKRQDAASTGQAVDVTRPFCSGGLERGEHHLRVSARNAERIPRRIQSMSARPTRA